MSVYELRTYYTHPGKLEALNARFQQHTIGFFEKYDMRVVGFFEPTDEPLAGKTLVYILSFDDRAAADASWEQFKADPDWLAAKAASEADGPIVERIESVFLDPTDYSALN